MSRKMDEWMTPSPIAIQRANELLVRLLPSIQSHDDALNHLFYVTPDATPELRAWSLAAALYILREAAAAPARPPLIEYMHAVDRSARSAAWLRLYAAKVRDGTAVTFDIPNTLAQTIEDIAQHIDRLATK